ncbi:hypothetical protein M2189_001693 [Bradyrhizobium japonicum]|uniref:hypothetical protein n=1 Tax=Bradyrhizobium japonicum TaxID=375 RepID=UPI002166C78A|nr:hypothetical protein [Bradyrhizobium japonicum]MCS3499346.1 hypothetical protein [Bradyrhizobium japonicum]MCS3958490.1 hypothetical protein [Bradyrhizobium japonicum]MCS4000244.1 hypothetical protein [Bradyrhizobium japonicum]
MRRLEMGFPELGVDFVAIGASVELLGRDRRRRWCCDRRRWSAHLRHLHTGRRRLRKLAGLRRRRGRMRHRAGDGLSLLAHLLAHRRADGLCCFGLQRAFRFGFAAGAHRLVNALPQRFLEMLGFELTGIDGGHGGGSGVRGRAACCDGRMDSGGLG